MSDLANLIPYFEYVRPSDGLVVEKNHGVCDACGGYSPFIYSEIINDDLAKEWSLAADERRAFSSRESMYCVYCGCTYRLRALARAIKIYTNKKDVVLSLEQIIKQGKLNKLKIAEINSCGVLHDILRHAKGLEYSEYEPSQPDTEHQDLMKLTYASESFDIVLTSDTFEHIPDPKKALKEVLRVLKPGGAHIFTLPVTMDRKTRRRAHLDKENVQVDDAKPSFHGSGEPDYLVWNEFGHDFIDLLEEVGFSVEVYFQNILNLKDPSGVFVAVKPRNKNKVSRKITHIEAGFSDKSSLLKAKKLLAKAKQTSKETSDSDIVYFDSQRLEKIKQLYEKQVLTQRHAENLSDINKAYAEEIKKLNNHIQELQKLLESSSLSTKDRIYKKLRNTHRDSDKSS